MSHQDSKLQAKTELERIDERSEEFFQACKIRSAMRLAREATRAAKANGLAMNYMRGLFDQMRFGHALLDPRPIREAAVELIALLNDEEHARRIEPDLDEEEYYWQCSWMSSCAYDNLAEATGLLSGYNSEGMHECISDGIQVCRQTGKLQCIQCFREYASDVYLASEDLEMVRHQCHFLMDFQEGRNDDRDRRWSAMRKLAWVNTLEGRLQAAEETLLQAEDVTQAEGVYLKTRAKLLVAASLDEVLIASGKAGFDWSTIEAEGEIPETGEFPRLDLDRATIAALSHVMAGEFDAGIALLTDWDKRLSELECFKDWFEIRLRLIAAYLLKGDIKRAEALKKGLEARATAAKDHLTLRRLSRLFQPETKVNPLATLKDFDSGPYGHDQVSELSSATTGDVPAELDADDVEVEFETPLAATIIRYMEGIVATRASSGDQEDLLDQMVSHDPATLVAADASQLLHLTRFVVHDSQGARKVWEWAKRILEHFPEEATVLSVVADTGAYFSNVDEDEFRDIDRSRLEKLIKLSLSLNLNHAGNHGRAGSFFLQEGQLGEAERCFARAFRLDRTDGGIAIPLAELYQQTDRPRDAMSVLDLCLRAGSEDDAVAWEAAMTALQLQQFDAVLTYMNRCLELADERPWAHYYRACALLELGRFDECLEAIRQEAETEPPGDLHLKFLNSCALLGLGRETEARSLVEEILSQSFTASDYLSVEGFGRLTDQLWRSMFHNLPADDSLRTRFEHRLLLLGLLPDQYFDLSRGGQGLEGDVAFYRVAMRQPLGDDWEVSPGCLPDQEEWRSYHIDWGVLAESEEEAIALAMEWQGQCGDIPEVIDVEESPQHYRDVKGVVWQGMRWCDEDHDDEPVEHQDDPQE